MREELAWAAMKSCTEDILNLSSLVENQMMSGAQDIGLCWKYKLGNY